MTTIGENLAAAMRLPEDSDTVKRLHDGGLAVADEGTMSQAIHDVYCGIEADHDAPNEKDRQQALTMIAALQKYAASRPPA